MTRTAIRFRQAKLILAAICLSVGWIGAHWAPAHAVSLGDLPSRVQDAVDRHDEALAEFRIVLVAKQVGSGRTPLCEDPQLLRLIARCVQHHMDATNAHSEIQSRVSAGAGEASMEDQRALDRASQLIGQMEPLYASSFDLAKAGTCDPYRIAINVDQQHTEDQKARKQESHQERADFLDELVNEALRDAARSSSGGSEPERATPSSDWNHGRFSDLYLRYQTTRTEFKQAAADFLDRLDLLSAYGEEICHDEVLAYSYSESQRTGRNLAQLFEAIFGMVFPTVPSSAHQMLLSSPGSAELYSHLPVEDQIAFAEVASDFQNMSIVFDFIGAELSAKAEGCDPEELVDQGNRTAEEGQDPESGLDAGAGVVDDDGGPIDDGELRYEPTGTPSRQYEDTYAGCTQGGSGRLTIEVGDVQFPAEVRPDGSYTVRVPVQWSVSGTDVTHVNFVVVVHFFDARQQSDQIRQFSGNQTFQFNFSGAEINFDRDHGAILAQMGGGVECESGSSDDGASVTITQVYIRRGSN